MIIQTMIIPKNKINQLIQDQEQKKDNQKYKKQKQLKLKPPLNKKMLNNQANQQMKDKRPKESLLKPTHKTNTQDPD